MQRNNKVKQVFCIDDDIDMLKMLEALLGNQPYVRIHQYIDVLSALDVLRGVAPDLILLDIMMPEMNGITAYHQIRAMEKNRKTPIIFVTGRKREADLAQYRALGVPTITKPINPVALHNLVEGFL